MDFNESSDFLETFHKFLCSGLFECVKKDLDEECRTLETALQELQILQVEEAELVGKIATASTLKQDIVIESSALMQHISQLDQGTV